MASYITCMKKSGKTVLNFWPWKYCCGWVYMNLFKEWRLSFTVNLVQSVESTFWNDMHISILCNKFTIYFLLQDINKIH